MVIAFPGGGRDRESLARLPTSHIERYLQAFERSVSIPDGFRGRAASQRTVIEAFGQIAEFAMGSGVAFDSRMHAVLAAWGSQRVGEVLAAAWIGEDLSDDADMVENLVMAGVLVPGLLGRLEIRRHHDGRATESLILSYCRWSQLDDILEALGPSTDADASRRRIQMIEGRTSALHDGALIPDHPMPRQTLVEIRAIAMIEGRDSRGEDESLDDALAVLTAWKEVKTLELVVVALTRQAVKDGDGNAIERMFSRARRHCPPEVALRLGEMLEEAGLATVRIRHELAGIHRDSESPRGLLQASWLYDQVLADRNCSADQRVRSMLGKAESMAKRRDGDYHVEALGLVEAALTLAREASLHQRITEGLHRSAFLLVRMGKAVEAVERCEQALGRIEREGQETLRSRILDTKGMALVRLSRYREAAEIHGEELRLKQVIGDRIGVQKALVNLSYAFRLCGDDASAAKYARNALDIATAFDDMAGRRSALNQLLRLPNEFDPVVVAAWRADYHQLDRHLTSNDL